MFRETVGRIETESSSSVDQNYIELRRFNEADHFYDGLARVVIGDKSGYINFAICITLSAMQQLETERLRLRMFTPGDLDDLARIVADPDVMRYLGKEGKPVSREEAEVALASMLRHWARHGFGRWAIVHKEDERLIGYGGIRSLEGEAELVYLLDKPYWGRGLATEMARACLRYGFEEKRFDRILALTKPGNRGSRRVLEKIGMRYERDATYFDIDVVEYVITRAEYRPDDAMYILREVSTTGE